MWGRTPPPASAVLPDTIPPRTSSLPSVNTCIEGLGTRVQELGFMYSGTGVRAWLMHQGSGIWGKGLMVWGTCTPPPYRALLSATEEFFSTVIVPPGVGCRV